MVLEANKLLYFAIIVAFCPSFASVLEQISLPTKSKYFLDSASSPIEKSLSFNAAKLEIYFLASV